MFVCVCVFSDQSAAVKLGNPLLVLLQSPQQLLSHLLFDRQVTPDRYNIYTSHLLCSRQSAAKQKIVKEKRKLKYYRPLINYTANKHETS